MRRQRTVHTFTVFVEEQKKTALNLYEIDPSQCNFRKATGTLDSICKNTLSEDANIGQATPGVIDRESKDGKNLAVAVYHAC
ncbi:hypothetical protein CEXT_703671 [Caerostris extrusa]|uniref:Uncharacterized protein n=1 Tax=Caerostris extrusa TaxID=172846 RepID=A0AAV4MC77_CAEEX|nr:hypothetical protein CEXT_703671 [Caerostris extrusa]